MLYSKRSDNIKIYRTYIGIVYSLRKQSAFETPLYAHIPIFQCTFRKKKLYTLSFLEREKRSPVVPIKVTSLHNCRLLSNRNPIFEKETRGNCATPRSRERDHSPYPLHRPPVVSKFARLRERDSVMYPRRLRFSIASCSRLLLLRVSPLPLSLRLSVSR